MANGKVALVTGAGSGIGRAVSLALMGAGYAVVLAGRRQDAIDETRSLAGKEARGLAVAANVTDPKSVQELFARAKSEFGRLDVLFNNAGMFSPEHSIEDVPFEEWQAAVNVNLTGAFLCTQQAFRIMKAQDPKGGRIINNGSISAHAPRPHAAAYTATKHAITGLTKSTSLDGRQHGIACGQIDIGNAASALTEKMKRGVRQANGTIETEPVMDVKHVAEAVLYMAGLPLQANVQFMTVMATNMPFVGRG